jgi:5'(3')-deoxyribonucleotidase
MKNKSIVLDLDGVIADIASSIDEYIFQEGDIDSLTDYTDWLITDNNSEDAMRMFNNPLFWKNMKPYEDAWHQVNKWFSSGIDVHIVTARRCDAAIANTIPWLDGWRIATLEPVFAGIHQKYEVIKHINPQFVVEDNPNEVRLLIDNGVNAFLRKQWYNKPHWETLPTIETLYDIDWN